MQKTQYPQTNTTEKTHFQKHDTKITKKKQQKLYGNKKNTILNQKHNTKQQCTKPKHKTKTHNT